MTVGKPINNCDKLTVLQVPGVPLIFGLRNALFLEPPSAFQRQFAKNSEEERSHMTEKEAALLKKRTKDLVENWEIGDSSDENGDPEDENLEMQPKKYSSRKGMTVKDRPQFKRKKAKVYCLLQACLLLASLTHKNC